MIKNLFMVMLLLIAGAASAQQVKSDPIVQQIKSDSISPDILKAPSSPAFNILGISPSQIDRPTDLNAFKLSVQNATNNFSKFPNSYSVEVAPASLLKLKNQTLDKLNSTQFKDVFPQSLSISFGTTQASKIDPTTKDTASYTRLGFGVKFSLVRPKWSDATTRLFNNLKNAQQNFLNDIQVPKLITSLKDSVRKYNFNVSKRKIFQDSLITLNNQFAALLNANLQDTTKKDSVKYKALHDAANNFMIERKGFFLDFAGGLAIDFPTDQFNYSVVNKAGAWVTTGYEGGNNGFSILGIGRYLYQPDQILADPTGSIKSDKISTLDLGERLLYNGYQGKFTASVETIYRSILNKNTLIDPSWRCVLNLEYTVNKGQKITFAFGKDFDNTITKSGNLITALNYIIGFGGNTKRISNNR
jgi:hypothetical protein